MVLYFYYKDGKELKCFDYIVFNLLFKLDFSDFRDEFDSKENKECFFVGIFKVFVKVKDKMVIYLLFLQYIIVLFKFNGKVVVVVLMGFIIV